MSSCEGSCCMSSPKASCAFATSASSAPAIVPRFCRCAFGYSGQQRQSQTEKHSPMTARPALPGRVLDATGLCYFSNGSPRCNFAFALHPICSQRPHDTHRKTSPTLYVHRREQDCVLVIGNYSPSISLPHTSLFTAAAKSALSRRFPAATRTSCDFENP